MANTKTDRLVNGFFISLCFLLIFSAIFSDVLDKKIIGVAEEPVAIVINEKNYNKKEFIERYSMYQKVMASIEMVGARCKDKKIQEVYRFLKKSQLCYVENGPHYLFSDTPSVGIEPLKNGEDFPYEITRGRKHFRNAIGLYTKRMNVLWMKNVEKNSILSNTILAYHEGYHALLSCNDESTYYENGTEEAIVRGLELKIMKQLYGKHFEDFLNKEEKKIKLSNNGGPYCFLDDESVNSFLSIVGAKNRDGMSVVLNSIHYWIVIDLIDKNVWDKNRAMRLKAQAYYKMYGKD